MASTLITSPIRLDVWQEWQIPELHKPDEWYVITSIMVVPNARGETERIVYAKNSLTKEIGRFATLDENGFQRDPACLYNGRWTMRDVLADDKETP